jgi:hypothetical protein
MCLWVSYKEKKYEKNFFCILKVSEERSRIRSSDPKLDPDPLVRGTIPGTAPKCHGSPTLKERKVIY